MVGAVYEFHSWLFRHSPDAVQPPPNSGFICQQTYKVAISYFLGFSTFESLKLGWKQHHQTGRLFTVQHFTHVLESGSESNIRHQLKYFWLGKLYNEWSSWCKTNFSIQNTRTLHTLSLAGNWLQPTNIQNLLEKVPNLENVDLSNCHLVQIPTSLFDSNPRLKSINISDNYLISIETGVFNHLSWLESLDLSSNYFMDFTREFFDVVRKKDRLKMIYLQVRRVFECNY